MQRFLTPSPSTLITRLASYLAARGCGLRARRLWSVAYAMLGMAFLSVASDAAATSPNVLIILADDLGYADLQSTGADDIRTPHLDALRSESVSFSDAYTTAPVCVPGRMGLLTGRYQEKFGVQTLGGPGQSDKFGLPLDELTLADRLKAAGYVTGIVGKWHLGEARQYWPNARGFDEFYGFLGGGMPYSPERDGELWRNDQPVQKQAYLTDAFGTEAVEFIHRHQDTPFFLFLSFNAVHLPLEATAEYLYRYRHITDPARRYYAAMTASMDDNIGRVLGELERTGVADNTLVIFLSDNGGVPQDWSHNTPYRGGKYELYEGGIRTPFFLRWREAGLPTGTSNSAIISTLDIAPTVLRAVGVDTTATEQLDGRDLLPLIHGVESADVDRPLFWRYGPHMYGLRKGPWKLLRNGVGEDRDPSWQLYHLGNDPGETRDLAGSRPAQVQQLAEAFTVWDKKLPPPLWIDQRLVDGNIWWRKSAKVNP